MGTEATKLVGEFSYILKANNRLLLSFGVVCPVSGEGTMLTEQYQIEVSRDPHYSFLAKTVYPALLGGEEEVSNSFYNCIHSIEGFCEDRKEVMNTNAVRWLKRLEEGRKYDAAKAVYDAQVRPVLIKRGFNPEDEDGLLFSAMDCFLDTQTELVGELVLYVSKSYKTDGAFRKAVRGLLSAGKEYAREEYPEDYREADEKAEFYEDHLSEIAEGMASMF